MILNPSQIRAMLYVRRWRTKGVLREQSLAEHSHQVALLAQWLAPEGLGKQDLNDLAYYALVHDAHESLLGDTPSPARRALLKLGIDLDAIGRDMFWRQEDPFLEIPAHLKLLLDVADVLEAAMYAQEFLPSLAPAIVKEAVEAAKGLRHGGMIRALQALGIAHGQVV